MDLLVNCSCCHRPLRLPQGATSVRCVLCQAVTPVASRAVPQNFLVQTRDLLVNCSYCHRPLCLPQGASLIRCVICQAVTQVAISRTPSIPAPVEFHQASYTCQPVNRMPSGPLQVHCQKRAVICAVSYKNTKYELKGCVNDAKWMRFMLISKFRFPESSILMLTEEETDSDRIPSKKNIRRAMDWLVEGCQQGDSLVFHFSGHGLQQKDLDGDELDGFDETICPMDFETEGVIVDDEINEKIVRPIPYGVKLHAIVDACHSGTVLDLQYLCRMDRKGGHVWEDHRPKNGTLKGTSGGEVFAFSGCDDHQTSGDTNELSKVTFTGAMTFALLEALDRGDRWTYGGLLTAMRATVHNFISQSKANVNASTSTYGQNHLHMLPAGGHTSNRSIQEPQLTANEPFEVFAKPFCL